MEHEMWVLDQFSSSPPTTRLSGTGQVLELFRPWFSSLQCWNLLNDFQGPFPSQSAPTVTCQVNPAWKQFSGRNCCMWGVPIVTQRLTNPTRIPEDAGLIPGLAQWVKDPVFPWAVLCVGCGRGLDSTLLWLWCRPAATALIYLTPSLGTSICLGADLKRQK